MRKLIPQVFWLGCLLLLTQGLKISNNMHEFSTGALSSSHYAVINLSPSNGTNSTSNLPNVSAPYNLSYNLPNVSAPLPNMSAPLPNVSAPLPNMSAPYNPSYNLSSSLPTAPYNLSSNLPTVAASSYGALTPSNSSPALVPGPSSFGNPIAYQQLPVVTAPVVVIPPPQNISAPYSPYTPPTSTSTLPPPQNGSSVSVPQNGSNSTGFISSNTKQWMKLNAQCPSGSYYSSVYNTC